ncbi:MAG TPA: dephospho-CoA kinase, partial [Firmicutes bacterium]|nr:dephospho-CoA kinase [Bacillota bacterium]
MRVIGLTGGIACGKSAVSAMLRGLGVRVVDADQVAREVVASGSDVLRRLGERFGPGILRPDGSLDRARLGQIVFHDPQALADLNGITHPVIRRRIEQLTKEARDQGVSLLVVEAPLLFEAGMDDMVDEVWVVTCTPQQQMERLQRRDGLSREEAEVRLRAQMSLEEKV